MATITITIPDKDIKQALGEAAKDCGYTLKDGFTVKSVQNEMCEDIQNYITNDLEGFFKEGIAADCYTDAMTGDDE